MGLDMYLIKEVTVMDNTALPSLKKVGVDSKKVTEVHEQVMYWRKVNAIHNWFVKNVQDGVDECQKSYVTLEQLETLLGLVNQVMDAHTDEVATKLLPPVSGFFFGGTEIDEYYWEEMKRTKKELTQVIADWKKAEASEDHSKVFVQYFYQSSW